MNESKLQAAKSLAKSHFRVERQLRRVHLIEPLRDQDPSEPIKLLEVVEGTFERGIEPIRFPADPARGIEYPVVIVEISPAEYKNYKTNQAGKLGFRGWRIGQELTAR